MCRGVVLRIRGVLRAVLLLAIASLAIGARFHDGPIAIFAGGPFTSGELVAGAEPHRREEIPIDAVTSGSLWLFELAPRN